MSVKIFAEKRKSGEIFDRIPDIRPNILISGLKGPFEYSNYIQNKIINRNDFSFRILNCMENTNSIQGNLNSKDFIIKFLRIPAFKTKCSESSL